MSLSCLRTGAVPSSPRIRLILDLFDASWLTDTHGRFTPRRISIESLADGLALEGIY